ncbi:MAG TPA: hypothetical protein VKU39_19240 [Streptosporangiaceae bacterium]|nr:hypothetical protein [Streptosporangiaceae bacterium]
MATETLPFAPGRTRRPQQPTPQPAKPQATKPAKLQPTNQPTKPTKPTKPSKPSRVSSPRHTRPIAATAARAPRAPFLVLLVGLLGGALVSLLVISTTLDEGSYQINRLIQENNALTKQKELLQQQVATDSDPGMIAREAAGYGMRPDKDLRFVSVPNKTISTSKSVTAP